MNLLHAVLVTFLFGFLLGCTEEEKSIILEAELVGEYQGVFERGGSSSKVILNLDRNQFSGSSDQLQFPTICKGSYVLDGSTLTFQDECFYNGLYDSTLILNGDWEISLEGDQLTMSGGERGMYRLNMH